ncbi:MAG: uracil-DNA glycosylase [Burkholderiaceae bacterium]|nr:uracil-DNA glycosylase [Burkholderiaceae bacterium]
MIDTGALAPGWSPVVEPFFESADGRRLLEFLEHRKAANAIFYPPQPLRALTLTAFDDVRVVILGQDPYHGDGQAHGLAFSVPEGVKVPPSLRNIFAELQRDLACAPPVHGTLEHWARQGVLLLNAIFTVERAQPGSHARRGWETLTSMLIEALAGDQKPKVFMLWGAFAQARHLSLGEPHLVLQANHPSPLSARRPPTPFIGCGHFSRSNAFLQQHGRGTIVWCKPGLS